MLSLFSSNLRTVPNSVGYGSYLQVQSQIEYEGGLVQFSGCTTREPSFFGKSQHFCRPQDLLAPFPGKMVPKNCGRSLFFWEVSALWSSSNRASSIFREDGPQKSRSVADLKNRTSAKSARFAVFELRSTDQSARFAVLNLFTSTRENPLCVLSYVFLIAEASV